MKPFTVKRSDVVDGKGIRLTLEVPTWSSPNLWSEIEVPEIVTRVPSGRTIEPSIWNPDGFAVYI